MNSTLLALIVLAASVPARAACDLPLFHDRQIGFAVGKPAGWRLNSAGGVLSVSPDASGATSAIVAPLRLKAGEDESSALKDESRRLAQSMTDAGGRLNAQPAGNGRMTLSGSYKGTEIRGELETRRDKGGVVVFGGWAPKDSWAGRRETILGVGRCYQPERGAMLSPQRRTGSDATGASTTYDFLLPEGWNIMGITSRGLDLKSGEAGVSFGYMTNAPGVMNVRQWLDQAAMMIGQSGIKILAERALPSASDPMGLRWDMMSRECEWNYQGRRLRGVMTGAVANMGGWGYGAHSAMLSIRYAPARQWDEYSPITAVVQESIRISGATPGRGLMLPKNNPADDSSIMSAWENRNRAQDRASARYEEAIMGYDNVRSPTTGQAYQAPLNAWNPAGPDGAGYYRALPNGFQEKLELVNP